MRLSKWIFRILLYTFISAVILSRAVSSGINHDENQFIVPAQLLVKQGLLPYLDYPYTHMPYAMPFYALAIMLSPFNYLAARLLGVLTWLACIAALVAIFNLIGRSVPHGPSVRSPWASLVGELALVAAFAYHPLSIFLQGSALNHMLATLFALLALLAFLRGITDSMPLESASFWSGLLVSVAAFTRFNYASLVPVLWALWLIHAAMVKLQGRMKLQGRFVGGVLLGALPAIILAAMAPAHFYYGNIVYIQLNARYYSGLRLREMMALASKAGAFIGSVAHSPIDIMLYAILIVSAIVLVVRLLRRRYSIEDTISMAAIAFAVTLFVTAFAPTPSQLQYFFAPLPFLLILLALLARQLYRRSVPAYIGACVLVLGLLAFSINRPTPVQELDVLLHRDAWPPLQIHAFADALSSKQHVPAGRILAILPMVPADAGYASYPFTATGPFSWRTSLLLDAKRRAQYGVISPEELPALLDATPPVAILTGLEPPKAGFSYRDFGGLERPFAEYAAQHDYKPVAVYAPFLERSLTLWVRQP